MLIGDGFSDYTSSEGDFRMKNCVYRGVPFKNLPGFTNSRLQESDILHYAADGLRIERRRN